MRGEDLQDLVSYSVMKAVHMSSVSNSQDIRLELDSSPPSSRSSRGVDYHATLTNVHRAHSRSASWSLPGPQGAGEFSRGLVSLNPMTPITNVIREIAPSFRSRTSETSMGTGNGTPHLSRNPSQTSLLLGPSEGEDSPEQRAGGMREGHSLSNGHDGSRRTLGNSSSNVHVHLPHEHVAIPMGGQGAADEPNVGLELSDSLRWLEHNTIFIILLLIKFAWYHRSGLMVILGMFGTFLHCNQVIRHQVALKNRRQVFILFLVVAFLAANIYFVYYVFWDKRLHLCLIFLAPHFTVDLGNLIWSIWVTDYIIRFGTMGLKALVAAMFIPLLQTRKKGKYYMLLEHISQFYRTLVPAPLWVRYLSNPLETGAVFAVLITAVYLMIKGGIIFTTLRELYRAVIHFLQDQLYGVPPSPEQLSKISMQCAICQDDFSSPLLLPCQHIFCENCVLQWLDRQNTCPLCRATIGNCAPKWRDGSTPTWPQIF